MFCSYHFYKFYWIFFYRLLYLDFTINEFVCYNETKQKEKWKICEISKPLSLLTLCHCHYFFSLTLPIDSTFVAMGLVAFSTLYFWFHPFWWPVCFCMQMNPMPFLSNFSLSANATKGYYNVITITKYSYHFTLQF